MPDSTREELRTLMYAGKVWRASATASISGNASVFIGVQTSDQEIVLEGFDIITNIDDFKVIVYEGGTFSGGLLDPPLNTNRNAASEQLDAKRYVGVTVGTLGTPIYERDLFTWQNIGANLNQGETTPVTIMKNNTNYIFELRNQTQTTGKVSTESVYSETDL